MRIIAGSARGSRLLGPVDSSVRPALDQMRESIFSILGQHVEQSRVLDLFAGVGSFGLEALSRGAARALFVELSRATARILQANTRNLGFQTRSLIEVGDALCVPDLRTASKDSFELVFLDPPFIMLSDSDRAERLNSRVRELVESPAVSDGAIIVLRIPVGRRRTVDLTAVDERRYGESTVLFFRREAGEPTCSP